MQKVFGNRWVRAGLVTLALTLAPKAGLQLANLHIWWAEYLADAISIFVAVLRMSPLALEALEVDPNKPIVNRSLPPEAK